MKSVSKIDVSQWGEFKIGDLFDYERGKEGAPKQVPDGDIPLISETSDDNGFARNVQSAHVFPANTITVSVNYAQTVFVQAKPYCASVNIIVLLPTWKPVTHNSLLFLASVISSYNSRYDYQDKVSKARLLNSKIKLPIRSDGKPDWEYMDNYIAKLAVRAHRDVSSLNQVEPKRHQINISDWKEFKVGDLLNFDSSKQIYHAENLDILDKPADNSYHPYVVRSGFNNGIRGYINENPNTLNPGNTISFAQDTAQLFYQAEPYFTGNKIKICSLKDEQELTKPISLFLIASLLKSFSMFSWDSSFNVTTLKRVKIKLPITSDGKPNWDYMDNYVTNLTTRTFRDVNSLRMLTGM